MLSLILDCIFPRDDVCVCVSLPVHLSRYYDNLGHVLVFFWFPSIGSSLLYFFITNSIEIFPCLILLLVRIIIIIINIYLAKQNTIF